MKKIIFIVIFLLFLSIFTDKIYAAEGGPCCDNSRGYVWNEAVSKCCSVFGCIPNDRADTPYLCVSNQVCKKVKDNYVCIIPTPPTGAITPSGIDFDKIPDPLKPDFELNDGTGIIKSNFTLGQALSGILPYLLAIAGIILFLMTLGAGFTLITSGGDQNKTTQGKKMLTSAIIGFVIIFFAFWLMQILQIMTGLKLGF